MFIIQFHWLLLSALVFLNYFALSFGRSTRLRKEALNRMEEVMAKEHELLSLGGQAAAAAHSLRNSLINNKISSQELRNNLKIKKMFKKILNYYQVRLRDVMKF